MYFRVFTVNLVGVRKFKKFTVPQVDRPFSLVSVLHSVVCILKFFKIGRENCDNLYISQGYYSESFICTKT